MTNYNIKLTPQLINLATEGGLDSSILNGKSYQRTFNMFEVENAGNRKVIGRVADGGEFNDTTFQNSSGIGTFETGSPIAFDLNYVGDFIQLSNNNCTAAFTDDSEADETTVLTNYAIKSGEKIVFSMVTIHGNYNGYTGVGIANRQADLNDYLGTDTNSFGFWDDGRVYFDGGYVSLDLGFKQDGSVVDVAVDKVNNLMWVRVNGGGWNGGGLENPETASGGIDISGLTGDVYPSASPYAYQSVFGQISINNTISNPPAGFKVLTGVEQVPLTGYYYFNGNENNYWDNINNWWLDGISTIPAINPPTSNDNIKVFSEIQNNGGEVPTVNNMFTIHIGEGEGVNIGIEMNVSGTARFYNGCYIYISLNDSQGRIGKINGNCVFYGDDSGPYEKNSIDDAVVNGDATFYNSSYNYGTVTGDAIFYDHSYNYYGTVMGDAIFYDYSYNNYGTVEGNATFNDNSNNNGTVNGTVTCNTTGTCQSGPYFRINTKQEVDMTW